MTRGYGLVRGDAVALPLADESVDLIITSPPYFALRSYQDDGEHYDGQIGSEPSPMAFLAALWAVTDECWRVLKPTGSLWVDLGDKYSGSGGHNNANITARNLPGQSAKAANRSAYLPMTRCNAPDRYNQSADVPVKSLMGLPWRFALGLTCPDDYRTLQADDHGDHPVWTLRAEVIWSKVNGLPESVTDRVRRSHETWFHLTKGPRYYAAVDEVRERSQMRGGANGGARDLHTEQQSRKWNPSANEYNALGKLPGSVWTIPSEPLVVPAHLGVDHFAAFPQEWPRRIILGWSPPGICTACGQGRRPVVERDRSAVDYDLAEQRATERVDATGGAISGGVKRSTLGHTTEATITGYACACDVTLALTRPSVILDPFVGTGTVVMVARALGRHGVGVDLSRDYLRLARWRISESRHGAKSEARTNRERQGVLW